jgi:hypothetical protein
VTSLKHAASPTWGRQPAGQAGAGRASLAGRWRSGAIALAVFAGGVAFTGFQGWVARTYVEPRIVTAHKPAVVPIGAAPRDLAQEQRLFIDEAALPLLRRTAAKNAEALARARDNLGKSIDAYRGEIEPFIADLRSWGTQRRSFLRWLGGWWHGDERLAAYIDAKFRKHLFTEAAIAGEVADTLSELADDIKANENQLLVELREASAKARLAPPPIWFDRMAFSDGVVQRAVAAAGARPDGAVIRNVFLFMGTAAVATTVLPDAVSAVVRGIVGTAVTRTGTMVASEVGAAAADIGGSTAAGSEVPVVGNAVGFCVGLVAAIVVQHFAQEVQDDKLRHGLNAYIDGLKASLLGGAGHDGELATVMRDYVAQVDSAEAELVRSQALHLTGEP